MQTAVWFITILDSVLGHSICWTSHDYLLYFKVKNFNINFFYLKTEHSNLSNARLTDGFGFQENGREEKGNYFLNFEFGIIRKLEEGKAQLSFGVISTF